MKFRNPNNFRHKGQVTKWAWENNCSLHENYTEPNASKNAKTLEDIQVFLRSIILVYKFKGIHASG